MEWDGNEWEKYIHRLLKRRYGHTQYVEVPARHIGDFGIESFSRDGCAYQCYVSQSTYAVKEQYEAQRDKITTDINKFITNSTDLSRLFGDLVIQYWILVVPAYDSARLLQHATKKTKEVRDINLPYAAADFQIQIITDSYFEKEKKELTEAGLIGVNAAALNLEVRDQNEWVRINSMLVDRLEGKSRKLERLASEHRLEEFKIKMVYGFLKGQNLLDRILDEFPPLHSKISLCKNSYEARLEIMSLLANGEASEHFSSTLKEYMTELEKTVPNLESSTLNILGLEAISDWLMRCPLDF